MAIADARALGSTRVVNADICIAGGGAAGIALAAEFVGSDVSVCLLESGGLIADERTQSLYDLDCVGYPLRENYMSRARYFGGSCNLWAGRSMQLSEHDLLPRDWVAGSGWPISLAEIARYYPRAAQILGLPALSDADIQHYCTMLSPHEKRLFASGELLPTTSVWARRAKRFGTDYRPLLSRAPNIQVVLGVSVTAINLNTVGSAVESVVAATLERTQVTVRARHYVLACGGIENARLLLGSTERIPRGIGNDHDMVGRYFMDHPRAVFGKVHVPATTSLYALRGRPLADGKVQLGIGLTPEAQRREQLLNHYVTLELQTGGYAEARYQALVQTAKVLLRRGHAGSRWDFRSMKLRNLPEMVYLLSPKELMPHWLYRSFVAAREALPRRAVPRTFILVYFCEQPPDPQSRVTLGDGRDALGMRRARLHWRIDPAVSDSIVRMQTLLRQQFAATGFGKLEPGSGEISFTDASHHMGTTRMSNSPKQGVVDHNCQVHGLSNLFVAGSSVFPCAGYANPTLTIVALSLRLASHLKTLRRQ